MTNEPYAPPRTFAETFSVQPQALLNPKHTLVFVVLGIILGQLTFILAGNVEAISFYTIRSFLSGKTVGHDIVMSPIDQYTLLLLDMLFSCAGGTLGVISLWFIQIVKLKKTASLGGPLP